MEPPKNRQQLTQLIESHLNHPSTETELTNGYLLALKAKTTPREFCDHLKDFYGERWSDSFGPSIRAASNRLEKQIGILANSISRKSSGERVVVLLNVKYVLPTSRKRPAANSERYDPSAVETPGASPIEPPTSKRTAVNIDICDSSAPVTPPLTPGSPAPFNSFDHRTFITPKRSKTCGQSCFDM